MTDRRRFLMGAAAAGVAWTTPVIVTRTAAAASVSNPGFTGTGIIDRTGETFSNSDASMQSNSGPMVWFESNTTTAAAVSVNHTAGASTSFNGGGGGTAGTIASGTTVCTYFFRAERTSGGNNTGSITFPGGTIVGLAYENATRNAGNGTFGAPTVTYNDQGQFNNGDSGSINAARDTVTFSTTTNGTGGNDAMRIFVTFP